MRQSERSGKVNQNDVIVGACWLLITEFCTVRGEGGQKPIAGDSGAALGEVGGLEGDKGALLMLIEMSKA